MTDAEMQVYSPPVVDSLGEPTDVGVKYPVHLPRPQSRIERIPQALHVVDVVQERCELHLLIPFRHLTYPF